MKTKSKEIIRYLELFFGIALLVLSILFFTVILIGFILVMLA